MNDRFRFRAWNKKEKIMYYDAEKTYDFLFGRPKAIPCDNFEGLLWDEDFVVEQCTGLKDKNGKLIYEGDIVENGAGKRYVIFWCPEKLGFVARTNNPNKVLESLDIYYMPWKVIGNIDENPELLESEGQ